MNRFYLVMFALFAVSASGSAFASYNVTSINTTVILNSTNTNAKVVESLVLFVSNSSISQYDSARGAYNLTLSYWKKIIQTPLLTQHIVNPHGSVTNFTFIPGSLQPAGNGGGETLLLMSYSVSNVTTVNEIAPRKFEYSFNSSVLNFAHTASGQELPAVARLNIIVPYGAQLVSIYPLPDSPTPSLLDTYTNATQYSWYAQEPLGTFTFSYIITQSLQDEVLSYFSGIYTNNRSAIYALIVVIIAIFVGYLYFKFIAPQ